MTKEITLKIRKLTEKEVEEWQQRDREKSQVRAPCFYKGYMISHKKIEWRISKTMQLNYVIETILKDDLGVN